MPLPHPPMKDKDIVMLYFLRLPALLSWEINSAHPREQVYKEIHLHFAHIYYKSIHAGECLPYIRSI